MTTKDNQLVLGIVGPCGSGKSTLIANLRALQAPYDLHHIAQEHSYVPDMWQRLVHPHVLIFLDASFQTTLRRTRLNWNLEEYLEQHRRLSHARQFADLYVQTDSLDPQQVLQVVLGYLTSLQFN